MGDILWWRGLKKRVVVLDVTDAGHGNALGMGNADTTIFRLFDKIDFMEMCPNVLTNAVFKTIKVHMVMKNDEMAIKVAIKTCNDFNPDTPRIVMIKNSMDIEEIWLSEAYWNEVDSIDGIEKLRLRIICPLTIMEISFESHKI